MAVVARARQGDETIAGLQAPRIGGDARHRLRRVALEQAGVAEPGYFV
jgi:hypothetical protein